MKKTIRVITVTLTVCFLLIGSMSGSGAETQKTNSELAKTFSEASSFYAIESTTDGGYIAVGDSSGKWQALMMKFDGELNLLWSKNFGGEAISCFNAVKETSDGGFIAVGHRYSKEGDTSGLSKGEMDGIIAKYDAAGNLLWGKSFGGSEGDYFRSVVENAQGEYVVVGDSGSKDGDMTGKNKGRNSAIIVKYATDGKLLEMKAFGGKDTDLFNSVKGTKDGGYIISGYSTSADGDLKGLHQGSINGILVKYDQELNLAWAQTVSLTNLDILMFVGSTGYLGVEETDDEGYIVVGSDLFENPNPNSLGKAEANAIIAKYSNDGTLQWKNKFGGSKMDQFTAVQQTDDGGYLAVGNTLSQDGNLAGLSKYPFNGVIARYASDGNFLWAKAFPMDNFESVEKSKDDHYIVSGSRWPYNQPQSGLFYRFK